MDDFLGTSIQYSEQQIKLLEEEYAERQRKVVEELIESGFLDSDYEESESTENEYETKEVTENASSFSLDSDESKLSLISPRSQQPSDSESLSLTPTNSETSTEISPIVHQEQQLSLMPFETEHKCACAEFESEWGLALQLDSIWELIQLSSNNMSRMLLMTLMLMIVPHLIVHKGDTSSTNQFQFQFHGSSSCLDGANSCDFETQPSELLQTHEIHWFYAASCHHLEQHRQMELDEDDEKEEYNDNDDNNDDVGVGNGECVRQRILGLDIVTTTTLNLQTKRVLHGEFHINSETVVPNEVTGNEETIRIINIDFDLHPSTQRHLGLMLQLSSKPMMRAFKTTLSDSVRPNQFVRNQGLATLIFSFLGISYFMYANGAMDAVLYAH